MKNPRLNYLIFATFVSVLIFANTTSHFVAHINQEAASIKSPIEDTIPGENVDAVPEISVGAIRPAIVYIATATTAEKNSVVENKTNEIPLAALQKQLDAMAKYVPPSAVLAPTEKLFYLGGQSPQAPYPMTDDDEWVSQDDGQTYSLIQADSPWGEGSGLSNPTQGRIAFKTLYFNKRVWMLGGYRHNSTCSNDIWSSPDGMTNWRREVTNAPWSVRAAYGAVVFNNRMYIIAGASCANGSMTENNDVWSSTDGITWQEMKTTEMKPLPKLMGHSAVVYKNKIYVIGGFTIASGYNNNVYSSTDGKNWNLETTVPPSWSPRANFATLSYNGKMYLMGGASSTVLYAIPFAGWGTFPVTFYGDVWSTTNGATWVQEAPLAFTPREGLSAVVVGNKMVMMGGSHALINPFIIGDSFSSTSGSSWTAYSTDPALMRSQADAIVTPVSFGTGTFPVPNPVNTVQAVSTPTSITFPSNVNPKSLVATGWYEYKCLPLFSVVMPCPILETPAKPLSGNTLMPFKDTLTGLAPGMRYDYRAVVQNENGLVRGPTYTQDTRGCNPLYAAYKIIRILSPNGGQTVVKGQPMTLTWETCNIPSTALFNLSLTNVVPIVTSTPNDGTETFIVPMNAVVGPHKATVSGTGGYFGTMDFSDSEITVQ